MSRRTWCRVVVLSGLLIALALVLPGWAQAPKGKKPPSKEITALASYAGPYEDLPGILLKRKAGATGADGWEKVKPRDKVQTTDTLLTLPGFANLIRTSGLSILMRGNVPQFALAQVQFQLLESAVVLHRNKEFDLDLTLLCGRIFLINNKDGPAKIRLRFSERQAWDIELARKNDQVGVDYYTAYTAGVDHRAAESPRAYLFLVLIRGEATIAVNAVDSYTKKVKPPQAYLFGWDSFRTGSESSELEKLPPSWSKRPPTIEEVDKERLGIIKRMTAALKDLKVRLSANKAVNILIKGGLKKPDALARMLAIYCQGAIDDVANLVDEMDDEDPVHVYDRQAAIFTLRRWLARGAAQGKVLFDEKKQTGILIDKTDRRKKSEAKRIYDLLYDLPAEDWTKPETFEVLARCVASSRVAIAELGYSHLLVLSRGLIDPKKMPFNAADSIEDRRKFADKIEDMIARKQLPPERK
jgi:hypothetical protein